MILKCQTKKQQENSLTHRDSVRDIDHFCDVLYSNFQYLNEPLMV